MMTAVIVGSPGREMWEYSFGEVGKSSSES